MTKLINSLKKMLLNGLYVMLIAFFFAFLRGNRVQGVGHTVTSSSGSTYDYSSVEAAIDSSYINNGTLKLAYGDDVCLVFDKGYNITIDLNGYALTGAGCAPITVESGSLTIIGTGGIIFSLQSDAYSVVTVKSGAEFTLNSSTAYLKSIPYDTGLGIIRNLGTTNIYAGSLNNANDDMGLGIYNDTANSSDVTLNVTGGSNVSTDYSIYCSGGAGVCNVNISGGTIKGQKTSIRIASGTATNKLNITGGTLSNTYSQGYEVVNLEGTTTFTMKDGSIEQSSKWDYNALKFTRGVATVSGGTINGGIEMLGGSFTISGGAVVGRTFNWDYDTHSDTIDGICNGIIMTYGTFNLTGGSITGGALTLTVDSSSSFKPTVSNSSNGIYATKGTINISGGTIENGTISGATYTNDNNHSRDSVSVKGTSSSKVNLNI